MTVIIDTNLWVSFLIGKRMKALEKIFSYTGLNVYVCNFLIDEIQNVAMKPKIRKYVSETDVHSVLELIDTYCIHAEPYKKAISPVRDMKDLYLLSLAETVQADFIVTGDNDLLTLHSHRQTKIVTFREFERILDE